MAIDRTLPRYSLGEELISAISHGIGALLALAGTVYGCILASAMNKITLISMIVYGISMITMYTVSCVYHALARNGGKKVMRILDHCFIFVLIIGTYAPFSLAALGGTLGWTLFSIVLASGIVGITLNAIDVKKYAVFSMICYIASGWVIIFMVKPLIAAIPPLGLWLLIAGGIVYTVGAIFYGIGSKVRYIHSLWHFFVLGGTILHYFSILYSILLV